MKSSIHTASIIALLIAMVLTIGTVAEWAAKREADYQTDSIKRVIDIHALGLRGVAAKFGYLPFTASRHPYLVDALAHPGDPSSQDRVNGYLEEINRSAGSEALYLIDATGRTIASSNWRDRAKTFVGQSYVNRPYFIDARDGRNGSFYGIGQTTGEPGLFISAPVYGDGAVVGVVTVKVSLNQIQTSWALVRDPIMLTDSHGVVFLSSIAPWLYRATRSLDEDELAWVKLHQQYGTRDTFPPLPWNVQPAADRNSYLIETELDGRSRRFLAVDEKLADFSWTLTVMSDYEAVIKARRNAWALGVLCMGLLLLTGMYWRLRERRFTEQRDARVTLERRVRERTQELDEAHAFRKAMEDSLSVGMRARDLGGHIIYVNAAFCEMTGFNADELLGRLPPYPYWHPDDVDQHWYNNEVVMSGRSGLGGFESRLRHRNGSDVFTVVYTAKLIDAEGKHSGWMSSVVDITEQKRVALRQRQIDEQLQHAQRLASLGEMASTLAHEINQPLMALSNFASAAKAFAVQGEQAMLIDSLDETMAQARRTADIVRRIRGFVRQRTAGAEECDVSLLVVEVLALLQGELKAQQVRAVSNLPAAWRSVRGDRVLLQQVLLNLVLNSLQAMQSTSVENRVVEIDAEIVKHRIHIHIQDRGPGIRDEHAERVFMPFFTTKPGGLGLGLNICRTIVESHRGRLYFSGRPGGGTQFTLELECVH